MPLYEYACEVCGHADTLLEKITAAKRRKCPSCGKGRTFERQLSAPAFHLKGSGWYATDFRQQPTKGKDASNGDTKDKDAGAKDKNSSDTKDTSAKDKGSSDTKGKSNGGTKDKPTPKGKTKD